MLSHYFKNIFHFFLFCLSNYTYFRQLDMPSVFTEALFIFSKFMFFSWFLSIEFSQSLLPSLICYKTSPDFFFYFRDFIFKYRYLLSSILLLLFSAEIILLYIYHYHFSIWLFEHIYSRCFKDFVFFVQHLSHLWASFNWLLLFLLIHIFLVSLYV